METQGTDSTIRHTTSKPWLANYNIRVGISTGIVWLSAPRDLTQVCSECSIDCRPIYIVSSMAYYALIDLITAEYFKFKIAEGGKGLKQCGLSILFFRGGGLSNGDRFNNS